MTAGAADVVRALQLAAVRAFVRVRGDQRVVGAAHVAAGPRGPVLRDGHVSTSGVLGGGPRFSWGFVTGRTLSDRCEPNVQARPGTYCDSARAQALFWRPLRPGVRRRRRPSSADRRDRRRAASFPPPSAARRPPAPPPRRRSRPPPPGGRAAG